MRTFSIRFLLPFSLALVTSASLPAQTAGPSAEQLTSWVQIRQQRVDLLRDEIKQSDARIEARMDDIIHGLLVINDSKDSRTKVARIKEDTMKRLGKTIEYYDQKRRLYREELRNPRSPLTTEDKRKLIGAFDERIEKRARQLLALHRSMPAHQEYERYKTTGGGWYGTDYHRNEDYEQNRRITSHNNTQRTALLKQLDASIARLERMGRDLHIQLAATPDVALQKERAADVAKNDALITERRRQKQELLFPSDMASRGVALKEAMDLDQALRKSIEELRRDVTTLFQRVHTYVGELTALRTTEAALAAKKVD